MLRYIAQFAPTVSIHDLFRRRCRSGLFFPLPALEDHEMRKKIAIAKLLISEQGWKQTLLHPYKSFKLWQLIVWFLEWDYRFNSYFATREKI